MKNKLIPLRDYPKGLFVTEDNTLCVKTEYGNEAYIVWSGEYFWGGAKTKEAKRGIQILPILRREDGRRKESRRGRGQSR